MDDHSGNANGSVTDSNRNTLDFHLDILEKISKEKRPKLYEIILESAINIGHKLFDGKENGNVVWKKGKE